MDILLMDRQGGPTGSTGQAMTAHRPRLLRPGRSVHLCDQYTWQPLEEQRQKAEEHRSSCTRPMQKPGDEEEVNQLLQHLSHKSCHGDHNLHNSRRFPGYEQGCQWHHEALELDRRQGNACIVIWPNWKAVESKPTASTTRLAPRSS